MKRILTALFLLLGTVAQAQPSATLIQRITDSVKNIRANSPLGPRSLKEGNLADRMIEIVNHAETKVSLTGSYANPSWITSLDWSKITNAPSFVTSLANLTDVTLTAPSANNLLRYNGTKWVNWAPDYVSATSLNNNFLSKKSGSGLADSKIFDNGTNVGIGTNNPLSTFVIQNATQKSFEFNPYINSTYGATIEAIDRGGSTPINISLFTQGGDIQAYTSGALRYSITNTGGHRFWIGTGGEYTGFLKNASTAGATSDVINFLLNSSTTYVGYSATSTRIIANTNGAHNGKYVLQTALNGTLSDKVTIWDDGQVTVQNGSTHTKYANAIMSLLGGNLVVTNTAVSGEYENVIYARNSTRSATSYSGLGVGVGGLAQSGWPFMRLVNTSGEVSSISANNGGAGNSVYFSGANQSWQFNSSNTTTSAYFMYNTTGPEHWKFASRGYQAGGGFPDQNTDFMIFNYGPGNNANISWTTGSSRFRTAVATLRVNTSGTYAGNIHGFTFEPTIVAKTSGTVLSAFVAGNTDGYSLYSSSAATALYNSGIITTDASIKTGQPSANGAAFWKLGNLVTGTALTVQTTKWIEVEIGGTLRKIPVLE